MPNILVFHQSRAAVKFNQTERTFENFVSFVKNTTGKTNFKGNTEEYTSMLSYHTLSKS